MRARYYSPTTMSFISADPTGFDGGMNWYLYANGNPLVYIDTGGLRQESWNSAISKNSNLTQTLTQNVSNNLPTNAQMERAEFVVGGLVSGGTAVGVASAAGITTAGVISTVNYLYGEAQY